MNHSYMNPLTFKECLHKVIYNTREERTYKATHHDVETHIGKVTHCKKLDQI